VTNVSKDLVDALRRSLRTRGELRELDLLRVEEISGAVAERFVSDPGLRWWWDALRVPHRSIAYGEGDGIGCIRGLLGTERDRISMIVTDDEFPPWFGVEGNLGALSELLQDLPYFEYFLVDDSFEWIVFDTHSNTVVVAGIEHKGDSIRDAG